MVLSSVTSLCYFPGPSLEQQKISATQVVQMCPLQSAVHLRNLAQPLKSRRPGAPDCGIFGAGDWRDPENQLGLPAQASEEIVAKGGIISVLIRSLRALQRPLDQPLRKVLHRRQDSKQNANWFGMCVCVCVYVCPLLQPQGSFQRCRSSSRQKNQDESISETAAGAS